MRVEKRVEEGHRQVEKKLIRENQEVFVINDLELGRTETVDMDIDTRKHPPVYTKPYPYPQ